LECLTVSIAAAAEQKGRWMGLIVSACFEIDLINQPRFAWISKPSHGKGNSERKILVLRAGET